MSDHPKTVEDDAEVGWFGIVLLAGHLGLLSIASVSLWRVCGGGIVGFVTAGLIVLTYAALWRLLFAPAAPRRLDYKQRLVTTVLLGTGTVLLGALAQLWVPALLATSVVVLGDTLDERTR